MEQLHKRFTTDQIKAFFERYLKKELKISYLLEILGVGRRRFFGLLEKFRDAPKEFSIEYKRKHANRKISVSIEKNILHELSVDKKAIANKHIPLWSYNYSYVQERLREKYKQEVSLPTIIDRARKNDCYLKKRIHKVHDREVLTNYAGELIQHDSSHHLWAPDSGEKWYLITSIDDFSRFIFYAALSQKESVWTHILALESIALKWGLPFSFYVDSHSIFRYVRGRDEIHYQHHLLTDQVDPQWKQVLNDCKIKVIYALSPQAKGKVERPYRWLQDHLVRACIRQNVKTIGDGNRILGWEVHQYNYKRVHSTTEEIPFTRLTKAIDNKKSLFREFKLTPPFLSVKDIFCLRIDRVVDPYSRINVHDFQCQVKGSMPRQTLTLRIHPLSREVSEVRFWLKDKLMDVQRAKNSELKIVHF